MGTGLRTAALGEKLVKVPFWLELFRMAWHQRTSRFSCPSIVVKLSERDFHDFKVHIVVQSFSRVSLRPQRLQHSRLPSPSTSPRACSNSCALSQWCHSTISTSVALFSSCLQSFPASGSFLMRQLFASGVQSNGASALASVLSVNV